MTKRLKLNFFICLFFIYTASFFTNTATAGEIYFNKEMLLKQEVYYSKIPLPKRVKKIRENNPNTHISDREMASHLKKTLTKVTPEFAAKQFGIEWKDSTLSQKTASLFMDKYTFDDKIHFSKNNFFPAVAICKMGKFGYGLFLIDGVRRGQLIAPYLGEFSDFCISYNDYTVHTIKRACIDAQNIGGVARFANTIVTPQGFTVFGKELSNKLNHLYNNKKDVLIKKHNSVFNDLGPHTKEDRNVFITSNDYIKPFRQVIVSYEASKNSYWVDWFKRHQKAPCFLKKNGYAICVPDSEPDEL